MQHYFYINSLTLGRFQFNIRKVIFKLTLVNDSWGISYELALRWMPQGLTDDKSLVQVMAWCRQATSHYLSQCWSRSMSPNGITRPQWVKPNTINFRYMYVIEYNRILKTVQNEKIWNHVHISTHRRHPYGWAMGGLFCDLEKRLWEISSALYW